MKISLKVFALSKLGLAVLLIGSLCSGTASAQMVVGPDTTICLGGTATLNASYNLGGGGGINFNNLSTVSLFDDQYSPVINIGFPFTFYGNTYTQCLISSNNYVSFDIANANGYSPWAINNAIPNAGMPTNTIMCPYQDINPGAGGTIEYGTVGTAPNRIFVVRYLAVPMFGCTQLEFCSALFLYEGTNRIETHLENKPLCTSWNGGVGIHGLHDATGTLADVVPGRNFPTQWTATQDAWEFVPNGSNAYTINTIPFQGIVSNNNTVNWYQGPAPGTLIGTGASINVSPNVTTQYWAEVAQVCGAGAGNLVDSAWVTVVNGTLPLMNNTDATCNGYTNALLSLDPQGVNQPWDYNLLDGGGNSVAMLNGVNGMDTFFNLGAGNYTLIQTESNGCLSNIPIVINEPDSVHLLELPDTLICIGGTVELGAVASDGNGGPYVIVWDNGLVGPGPHFVNPISDSCFNAFATDQNGCLSETRAQCVTLNPQLSATNTGMDSICPGASATLNATAIGGSGTGYAYTWSDGQNAIGTGPTITVTPAANTTYCVTVTDDCETPPSMACHTVNIRPTPAVSFVADTTEGCFPTRINFTNTTPVNQVGTVVWEFGNDSTSTLPFLASTTYALPGCFDVSLTVTSPAGCVGSGSSPGYICARDYPVADYIWTPDPAFIFDPQVNFFNQSIDNITNMWYFDLMDSTAEVNPSFIFPDEGEGTYPVTLFVWNQFNCPDSVTYDIQILNEYLVYLPNAFTPNGDGSNDFFFVQGSDIDPSQFDLQVYNRFGQLIFHGTAPDQAWDGTFKGKPVSNDMYVWKLTAKSKKLPEKREYYGHVTVIR